MAGATVGAGCTRTLDSDGGGRTDETADGPTPSESHRGASGTPTRTESCRASDQGSDCDGIERGQQSAAFGRQKAEITSMEFGQTERVAVDLSLRDSEQGIPTILRATIKNTGDCGLRVGFGGEPPYTAGIAYTSNQEYGLMLVPVDGQVGTSDENGDGQHTVIPESKTDGCWLAPDTVVPSDESVVRYLDPCGSISGEYYLVGHSTTDRCIPERAYEFEALVRTGERLDREADWTCTIEIS